MYYVRGPYSFRRGTATLTFFSPNPPSQPDKLCMYAQDPFLSAPSLVSRIDFVGCWCQPLLTNRSALCADSTVLLLSAPLRWFWTKGETFGSARHGRSGSQGMRALSTWFVRVCMCVCAGVCVAGPAYGQIQDGTTTSQFQPPNQHAASAWQGVWGPGGDLGGAMQPSSQAASPCHQHSLPICRLICAAVSQYVLLVAGLDSVHSS